MDTKNYTQVLIDGKIYTLGGSEDEAYLQKAASYVNEKITTMHALPGFSKQSADYQQLMLLLNIADDYFKTKETALLPYHCFHYLQSPVNFRNFRVFFICLCRISLFLIRKGLLDAAFLCQVHICHL